MDPGVTVNSPDSFVVDNRYLPPDATAVPEPASGLLLIIGLIGLAILPRPRPLDGFDGLVVPKAP